MKRISSPLTLLYKIIAGLFVLLYLYILFDIFSIDSLSAFISNFNISYLIIIIPLSILLLITNKFFRLKHVYMDDDNVYISSIFQRIIVPINNIKDISFNLSFVFRFKFYYISFYDKNKFGKSIVITTGINFSHLILSSPAVNELENRIKNHNC